MKSMSWIILLAVAVPSVLVDGARAAEAPPKAPPTSQFAPAEDLATQVDYYLKRLDQAVATEEDYKDFVERIGKDSNTLIVIALTLGLHDTDNAYKAAAPAMIEASRQLAATKDYAAAKAGVEAVKKAVGSKTGDSSTLKWEKKADLKQLMLAVPGINTQLKRNAKLRRPKRDGPKAAGRAAAIGAIGQASLYHSADTTKPELADQWYKYCEEMRDAAAEVNAAAHKGDKKAARAAIQKLTESCDHCHDVFAPEAKEKAQAESDD
ncbi:MAG: cytochrome c [Pirellulales bacterium]|nr:cytochrome c [Pirellulales bacterium]